MADESGLTVQQKNETNKELETLKKAARGEISWFSKEPLMVGAKLGVGGAAGIMIGRYAADRYFPDEDAETGEADDNAVYKRAALKVAVGLGGAGILRKLSPVAAAGFAVLPIGDAMVDVLYPTVKEQFDSWFSDDTGDAGTGTGSGTGTGAGRVTRRVGAY